MFQNPLPDNLFDFIFNLHLSFQSFTFSSPIIKDGGSTSGTAVLSAVTEPVKILADNKPGRQPKAYSTACE